MSRLRASYGASPLHLLGLLATFVVAAEAVVRWFDAGSDVIKILIWFLVAAIAHDLVFLPLYSVLDRITSRAAAGARGRPSAWTSAYVRIPLLLSGLLFVVFFPLILGTGAGSYRAATGHAPHGYLQRWLIATAALLVASAVLHELHVRRLQRAHGARLSGDAGGANRR